MCSACGLWIPLKVISVNCCLDVDNSDSRLHEGIHEVGSIDSGVAAGNGAYMAVFRIVLEDGIYLTSGDMQTRLSESTHYVIAADDREHAAVLARSHTADTASQSAVRSLIGERDAISEWLDPWSPTKEYQMVLEVIEQAKRLLSSISIDGVVIVSPEHKADSLRIHVSEDTRSRVLVAPIYLLDVIPEWEDDKPFDATSLVTRIQRLF